MDKFEIDSYIKAIDNKDINELKNLEKKKYNNKDIVYEIYNNGLLTSERLHFIVKSVYKYLTITSTLIKELLKEDDFELLDIIFSNIKFYDNEIIMKLILHFKNNIPL